MLKFKTNIQRELDIAKSKNFDDANWKGQIERIFQQDHRYKENILTKLQKGSEADNNNFNLDLLESDKVYHIDQIRKICIDYRLRFLDTKYFKGTFPKESVNIIKHLEKQHNTSLQGFKIIAPSKLFKLENADDPLLFAPIGNQYYYLIHKWGNDLHPLRKWFVLPFKNFRNLMLLVLVLSWVCTEIMPVQLFTKEEPTTSTYLMLYFFILKAIAAVVLFYGFALGKNFNHAIWNSKYYNA